MEVVAIAILKAVVSAGLRFYLGSLLAGGAIVYDRSDLGYRVPKWYMNPGSSARVFYAYGTSVEGDEYISLDHAHELAIEQMLENLQLSNQALIKDQVHYDHNSIKQRRLVELFIQGEGMRDFIRTHAKVDRKQFVTVKHPEEDIRAFIRIALRAEDYFAFQEQQVNTFKERLMEQKTDDVLAEMEAELASWEEEQPDTTPPWYMDPQAQPNELQPAPPPNQNGLVVDDDDGPVPGSAAAFEESDLIVDDDDGPVPGPRPTRDHSVFDEMEAELDAESEGK